MKVSIKQYAQTLLELTENKSQQESLGVVIKFIKQLKADGQLKNTERIMAKYVELYDAAHGIVVAEVTTREAIKKEIKDDVEKFVKEKYSAKEVVINNVVKEAIKGGIIIRVGDEVLDASVSGQLGKLQNILSK